MFQKLQVIFLSLFLVSCGSEAESKAMLCPINGTAIMEGLCVVNIEYEEPDYMVLAVLMLDQELKRHFPRKPSLSEVMQDDKITVWIVDDLIMEDCYQVTDGGIFYCKRSLDGFSTNGGAHNVIVRKACLYRSAFVHELIHSWLKLGLRTDGDPDHSNLQLWDSRRVGACDINKVECAVNTILSAFEYTCAVNEN